MIQKIALEEIIFWGTMKSKYIICVNFLSGNIFDKATISVQQVGDHFKTKQLQKRKESQDLSLGIFVMFCCRHVRRKNSAGDAGGPSRVLLVRRHGSQDPHWRMGNLCSSNIANPRQRLRPKCCLGGFIFA